MPTVSHEKALRTRADGRRSLLVYLDPDVIKRLKKAAPMKIGPLMRSQKKPCAIGFGGRKLKREV